MAKDKEKIEEKVASVEVPIEGKKKVVETKQKAEPLVRSSKSQTKEVKQEIKKNEVKQKEEKKKEEKKPKDKAVVNGISLKVSSKHCFAICKMLKGKSPDRAIEILEDVVKKKKAVPMKNREVAHQKGKGIAGGRFPKKASVEIINLLKQLKANAIVNGIENEVITIAKANKASRPYRRAGRRAKRTIFI